MPRVPTSGQKTAEPTGTVDGRIAVRAARGPEVVVAGRCVDRRTWLPLAGCRVELEALGSVAEEHPRPGPLRREGTSGADGRFQIAASRHFLEKFQLRVARDGYGAVHSPGRIGDAKDSVILAGDVPMSPASTLEGRVVDLHGAPAAGVPLWIRLRPAPEECAPGFHVRDSASVTTTADGSFRIEGLAPGRVDAMHTSATPYELAFGPQGLTLHRGQGRAYLEIVVRPRAVLEGVVLDARGTPVADATVIWRDARDGSRRSARATATGADGRFRLWRGHDWFNGGCGPRGRLQVVHAGCDPIVTEDSYEWGRRDVLIVARRQSLLRVSVRCADRGTPIAAFRAAVVPCAPDSAGEPGRWHTSVAGGGEIDLPARRGVNELQVLPENPAWSPVVMRVAIDAPVRELAVELRRRHECALRVTVDGKPAVGAWIEVALPTAGTGEEFIHELGRSPGPTLGAAALLHRARCDEDGIARVSGPPTTTLTLQVTGGGLSSGRTTRVRLDPGIAQLEIALTASGGDRGRD